MALLTLNQRKAIFKYLGLGEYNKTNIKAFQKKYMLRKSDVDGIWGINSDNTLRTVYFTKRYTKNFKPEEFRCECGGKYCCGYPSYMKPAQLIHIQKIRDHYGKPIEITSGLRCKTWNSKCGGSIQNSLHMQGLALDFYQEGVTDVLANRKRSIKWIAKQPNHHYSYGNGIYRLTTKKTYSGSISAPYMGNALHTDTYDNVKPTYPKWEEPSDKPKTYKVIDVSDWQGKLDWKKVKADGVKGAIIRYADGDTLDARFKENMQNAKAAGLHIGAYIFSRAKSKAGAEKEATRLFNACKPYGCDMPLYIDLEAKGLEKYADTVAKAFIGKIKSYGGRPGVYANLNWWNNYLKETTKLSFAMWVAQYNDTMDYKPKADVGMWQYSSSGKVNGISGKVDMDKCYVAYWNADPLEPWYNVMEAQYEWSKNQKYHWITPTIANSDDDGTCVTFPAVSLQRLGLLPSGGYLQFSPTTKKFSIRPKDWLTKHPDIFEISYPKKTIAELGDKIKKGDIIGFDDPNHHTMVYMGKNSKGEPIFNTMGHTRGLYRTYSAYADRKIDMIVRIRKTSL